MKVFAVSIIALVATVYGKVTPDNFPQCKRSDPQLEKCILDGIEVMRPDLLKGIPQINVPALEPFTLPTLKLDRTAPNLRLKAVLKNMVAHGGGNFKIDKLKLNLNDKYAGEVKISIPRLEVASDYDVRGSRLLVLDINGRGRFNSSFTGITVVAKGVAKVIEKDGVEYLQADKVLTKVKINHGQVQLDEKERPLAAASAASFFNANPGAILDVLNPLIEETGGAIAKAFLNKIFGVIPLKELLLD